MTAIRSGPNTYFSSTSTSSIKHVVPTESLSVYFLIQPPVVALTTVLEYCSHETYGWPNLYEIDPNFATTYQMLGAKSVVSNFHLQDGLLC
jgi:hypothetical protein